MTEREQYKLNRQLIDAVWDDDFKKVKYFVKKDANIHGQEDDVLMAACEIGNFEIVKYFILKQELDIKIALNYATSNDLLEVVKYLILECNCDIQIAVDTAEEGKQYEILNGVKNIVKAKS